MDNESEKPESADDIIEETGAAGSTAEDTPDYADMIAAQTAQIEKLMAANASLQDQIGVLIRNGAGIGSSTAGAEAAGTAEQDESEPYVPLASLGAELGKRDYKIHNRKEGD